MREPNLAEVIRTCPHLSKSVHRTEQRREEKNRKEEGKGYSPTPSPSSSPPKGVEYQIWQTLLSGLHSLPANDHGRPWPYPNRAAIARLVAEFDPDLCCKAAREAKEIVQAQDRAPNITALFEKKLRELAEVRSIVRDSLGEES